MITAAESWPRLVPYVVSAASVAIVGLAASVLTRHVPLPHVSILFIAAVLTSAALWGFWPSMFAAVLSVAASAFFFYAPVFDLRVADAQNLADLAVFVIVAALTSRLAANVRARGLEARRRQQMVAALLAFNERLAEGSSDEDLYRAIVEHLSPVLGRPLYLLLPRPGGLAPALAPGIAAAPPGEVLDGARRVMDGAPAFVPGWRLERLATARHPVGVVAASAPSPRADAGYLKALLGHAALAIDRSRLREEIAEARLRAQGEALREALLNSVSHDLQTPLAAILGSASALQSLEAQDDPRARRELVSTIRDQAERLASDIENVLDLTRIRAGQIAPRLELIELADIVNAALRRKQRPLESHAVEVRLPPDLPMLRLDLFLMEHALANVLDNAAKNAPAGSPLRIAAAVQNGEVTLTVTDQGSGIRADDLERIFDPFYRGTGGAAAPGSGLGLAICRAFVEANGGSVVACSAGPGHGATVRIRLPVPEGAAAGSAPSDD